MEEGVAEQADTFKIIKDPCPGTEPYLEAHFKCILNQSKQCNISIKYIINSNEVLLCYRFMKNTTMDGISLFTKQEEETG